MPLNHRYKLLFVHIPKNAGTSIEYYFDMMDEPDFDEVTTLAHAHNRGANE